MYINDHNWNGETERGSAKLIERPTTSSKNVFGFIFQKEFHRSDVFAPLAQPAMHDVDLVTIENARLDPRHGHLLLHLRRRNREVPSLSPRQ